MPERTEHLTRNKQELLGRRAEFESADAIQSVAKTSIVLSSGIERPVEQASRPDPMYPSDERDIDNPLKWQDDALCAQTDPEAFFPEKGGTTRDAKRICVSCEVKDNCLDYAVKNDERFGIWGGMSERERRRLKKLLNSAGVEEPRG